MSTLAMLGSIAVLAALIGVAAMLLRYNGKRLLIIRAAAAASPSQLENIYTLVERTGTVAPNGFILARTNKRISDSRCLVPIPMGLPAFPWAGMVVEIIASKEVQFQFVDAAIVEPSFLGNVCRPLQVPRHQTRRAAEARNAFSPESYVANSPALKRALQEVCPKYPTELLSYLLCIGRESFEFEPIDQARIGTGPAWVQAPEYQTCIKCGGRMAFVLQLPGTVISKKTIHSGTYYLFGCTAHPDQTRTLGQFT